MIVLSTSLYEALYCKNFQTDQDLLHLPTATGSAQTELVPEAAPILSTLPFLSNSLPAIATSLPAWLLIQGNPSVAYWKQCVVLPLLASSPFCPGKPGEGSSLERPFFNRTPGREGDWSRIVTPSAFFSNPPLQLFPCITDTWERGGLPMLWSATVGWMSWGRSGPGVRDTSTNSLPSSACCLKHLSHQASWVSRQWMTIWLQKANVLPWILLYMWNRKGFMECVCRR